jgi:thiosulfate reductase cytochrome b subunit
MSSQKLMYSAFERFWHWMQSALMIMLMLTGFEIHGSLRFFGFEQAVKYHTVSAYALLVLIAFAIFWHITTGEWRQYVPSPSMVKEQAQYYLVGIFKGAPHPTKKTALAKLNPLQKIVYAGLKLLIIPVVVGSGVLYLLYRFPQRDSLGGLAIKGLEPIALVHTAGAFALVLFLISHLYLMTTGHTVTSNLRAMITGYEHVEDELEEEEDVKPAAASATKEAVSS